MALNLVSNQKIYILNSSKLYSILFMHTKFGLGFSEFINLVKIYEFFFMKRVLPGASSRLSQPGKGVLNSNFGDGPNFFRGFISRVSGLNLMGDLDQPKIVFDKTDLVHQFDLNENFLDCG